MNVSFYDILGIDPNDPDRHGTAAALWPDALASLTPGFNVVHDGANIVQHLQDGLAFTNIRPGVDGQAAAGGVPGQISFSADVHVTGAGLLTARTFYLRSMPDVGIQLVPTDPDPPAQLFFAQDGRGYEVILDRLPVRIFLKRGLADSLGTPPEAVGSFAKDKVDGFAYTLQGEALPSEVDCVVRLHLLPSGDVVFEPTVPISLGPVRFMGLPAKNVYDIQLIPSPNLREYFEWARNDIGAFMANPPVKGALGFRSIEVDFSKPPFSDLRERIRNGALQLDNLELVLEDVVVPISSPMLPIPSHGTFGFRRKITDRTSIAQAYDLHAAPARIRLYGSSAQGGNGGSALDLTVEKFLFATGNPPTVQFQAGLIWQTAAGNTLGATIGIDDEWTLTAGFVMGVDTTPVKFTIADTTLSLVGIKLGVSFGRLARQLPFGDSFEVLADLALTSKPTGSNSSFFKLRSLTGKDLSLVLRDIGYKLGHVSLDGLQMPDGMQLIFANTVRIIIEEMGWVEEPNGTPYFSFSGGVALGFGGGNAVKPSGDPDDKEGSGVGLRVRRLRFRTNDDSTQPLFKIDGLFLNLHFGTLWIEGFGYISDFEADGWAIKEWGFGVKIQFDLLATKFLLAAQFIKGSRRNLASGDEFDYFLASLLLGWLPAGAIGLYDIRALVANNMAPNLDGQFPDGEGMALLKWHQDHDGALSMPRSRTLADWIAEKDSFAFGVGCGFSFNGAGNAMKIDVFIFFAKSKANTGLLVVGDLFLLKNPKPVAFVAVEYDFDKDKFGIMVGVDIGLADFAGGSPPSWIANIARLTGTIYFGNKPWALAIGQLADQRSWLSLNINWNIWLTMKVQFGIGLEIVDGGPKGFGFVFTLSAGANWGIGSFVLWGTFGFIYGTWKTGSDSTGLEIWLSLGFKINLFFIFSFGADITARLEYLGKHPWYITLSAEIRIDTPWFLPDVTVRFEKTWQEPLPFDTSTITQCLELGAGIEPGSQSSAALSVPPLSDGLGDPKHLYTFNELVNFQGQPLGDTHLLDLPIVSTDATIAINFTQPVSNDSLIATSTYDGTTDTGVQQVQDFEVRYGMKAIGIRRSPRFGPTAGIWTDLLKSDDTTFSVGGVAPETVTFAWDVDTRADGKLAPKRLLVNSSSPYSFISASPQNDEEAVSNDPDYPCCDGRDQRKTYPKPHILQFGEIAYGSRAPSLERFTGNGAWWHWILSPTPVVASGDPQYPGSHVARFTPRASRLTGFADNAKPMLAASITLAWGSLPGILFFEGYDGIQLVAQQKIDLHKAGNGTFTCTVQPTSKGMTRLVVRVEVDKDQAFIAQPNRVVDARAASLLADIAILNLIYYDLADYLVYVAGGQRCGNAGQVGPPGSDGSGKLAWLPNHDYEMTVTTEVRVSHKSAGSRTLTLAEPLYFRTKGLPGLNACPNAGDDLRLHVENTYPRRRDILLYRAEPTVLSFTEGMSSVLPIDRVPKAGDPPEKAQMFPLLLNVDRIASLSGLKRLTVPSGDWIAAHRANPYPIFWFVAEPLYAKSKIRRAVSLDPLVLRFEAIKAVSPACGPQTPEHASQVLLHEPIDQDGGATAWEPQTGYRATVRQKDGPFTERSSFDLFDLGAFIRQADSGPVPWWSLDGSSIAAPSAGTARQYLAFGELTWDHLQVLSALNPHGAVAGLAVGVSDGTPVQQAMIATVEPDAGGFALVLRRRRAATETELGRATITVNGSILLKVVAFDDTVRASVGDVVVEGPRGDVREGRVALVANGPATFAGVLVDALDMFVYDFVTSRFASFQEHIDSYDGSLGSLQAGDFGDTPATIVSVLAAHGTEIAPLMQAAADPQERQKLFATVTAALGIGLRKNPAGLRLSRLNDATGTYGLLLESPEALSFTRDVTASLVWHTRKWVGGIVVDPPIFPGVLAPIATLPPLPTPPTGPRIAAPALGSSLAAIRFEGPVASVPRHAVKFDRNDLLLRAVDTPQGTMLEVYDPPQLAPNTVTSQGRLREIIPLDQAQLRDDLRSAMNLAPGAVAIIHAGGVLGPIWGGHWESIDVTLPLTVLSNGAENVALLLSHDGAPLSAGNHTLSFTLDRDRWRASGPPDPEQHYHQQRALSVHW